MIDTGESLNCYTPTPEQYGASIDDGFTSECYNIPLQYQGFSMLCMMHCVHPIVKEITHYSRRYVPITPRSCTILCTFEHLCSKSHIHFLTLSGFVILRNVVTEILLLYCFQQMLIGSKIAHSWFPHRLENESAFSSQGILEHSGKVRGFYPKYWKSEGIKTQFFSSLSFKLKCVC